MAKRKRRQKRQKELNDKQRVIVAMRELWDLTIKSTRPVPKDPTRLYDLHPSSYPYCGLRHSYEWREYGIPLERDESMLSTYILENGKLMHSLLQEWLGKASFKQGVDTQFIVLGNWKCRNKICKTVVKLCEYAPCPKCGGDMEYKEIGIFRKGILKGHIDKVLLMRFRNYVIILDYKSSSVRAIQKYRNTQQGLPHKSNVAQLRAYCALFAEKYKDWLEERGAKVVGGLLLYASRDAPSYWYEPIFIRWNRKQQREELQRIDNRDIPHFKIVTKKKEEQNLTRLIDEKLCPTQEWYYQNVHSPWSPCPLGDSGKCFKRAKLQALMEKTLKKD